MNDLQREVNDLFEQFFPTRRTEGDEEGYESALWAPRTDISETEDAHVIRMDLPGVSKDEVEVTVEDGVLKISGERSRSREESDGDYSRVERSYGRFYRSFRLGQQVDPADIEATHENGVLTISLPKAEESRPHRIDIA
jgi:HSP20 family protein